VRPVGLSGGAGLRKTRIPPVDVEVLPGDLREVLEEQRKRYFVGVTYNGFTREQEAERLRRLHVEMPRRSMVAATGEPTARNPQGCLASVSLRKGAVANLQPRHASSS
jgi:hypothetical protein